MTRPYQQNGFILLPVVLAIVLTAVIAFMLNNQSILEVGAGAGEAEIKQAEYVTKAGLEHAVWGVQNSSCGGDMSMTSVPFGQSGADSYSATATTGGSSTAYSLFADQDAWIDSGSSDSNNGSDAVLKVMGKADDLEQPLVRFDLSSLPSGAQINSAMVSFYVDKEHPEGPVTVHRIGSDWVEDTVTWDILETNIDEQVLAMIPPQPQRGVWVQVNITAQVQAWMNGDPNNGIALISNTEELDSQYISREGPSNQQPRLDVVVGTGSATPAAIQATGTLANGVTRTLSRPVTAAYQPPGAYVIQPNPTDGIDAYIWEWYKTQNFGNDDETWVSKGTTNNSRSLLRFNLAGVPAGSKILSATLSLHHESGNNSDVPVTAHRINNPWNEAFVTWNRRDNGINWDTAGGDFDATYVSSTDVGPGSNIRYEWDIASLVQGWSDGAYPNYGVALSTTRNNSTGERFYTSDEVDPTRRPRLTIEYACECGSACLAPQGSGNVLFVVDDKWTPVPADQVIQSYLEDWGYTVELIADEAGQSGFNADFNDNDVVLISESVSQGILGTKVSNAPIGVVTLQDQLNDELGIATNEGGPVSDTLDVVDNDHFITRPFPAGSLRFKTAATELGAVGGTVSPDALVLANAGAAGALVALDAGGISTGGGNVPARRVLVPTGRAEASWNYLTNNGLLVVQRALAWGMGAETNSIGNLLFVSGGFTVAQFPSGDMMLIPTAQEQLRIDLIESWGYAVNLIDDDASQTDFDTAIAANDVAYIPQDITSSSLGSKLTAATIGIVNEEGEQVDELGFSAGVIFKSDSEIDVIDNSHYITETFATGFLTYATSNQSIHMLSGQEAPGLQTLGQTLNTGAIYKPSLVTLDPGDELSGGGSAAGRRVELPWGGGTFDINALNDDGRTIMKRSIEWASGVGSTVPSGYYDQFNQSNCDANDYSGSDGSLDWSPWVWTEVNESDGSCAGQIQIASDLMVADPGSYRLRVTGTGVRMRRELDLSTFANATLEFDYRLEGYPVLDFMRIRISTNGGIDWTELDRFEGPLDQLAYQSASYDITAFKALDTIIQFEFNGVSTTSESFFDNIRVHESSGATGPIAHWKLDDGTGTTAIDSEGGHHGTLTNGPTWVAGQLGDALNFDGNNDYVDLTSDAELDDVFIGGATVMAWIEPAGWGASGYGRLFDKSSSPSSTGDGWVIRLNTDNQGLNFGQGFSSGRGWWRIPNNSISLGSWQHIALSYDASSTANDPVIYVNGSPVVVTRVDTPSGSALSDAAINLRLGIHASSEVNGFDGKIDDARIFDRMLSAAEIADIGGGGGGGGGACAGTFSDDFETGDYTGSTGTATWAGDWTEINDSGNPGNGDVVIAAASGNQVLQIGNSTEGAQRVADLSTYTSATLTLGYWRSGLDSVDEFGSVEVSTDGSNWTVLDQLVGPGNDSTSSPPTVVSYDISAHLSATTHIRFLTAAANAKFDRVLYDDIEICANN